MVKLSLKQQLKRRASLLLVGIIAPVVLSACGAPNTPATPLVWWSVFDDSRVFRDMITAYEEDNNVDIEIVAKSFNTYEDELITALAAGRGPDIITFHNEWLPEHRDILTPIPTAADFASVEDSSQRSALEKRANALPALRSFVDSYVDVVAQDFTSESRIYAVPLYVDSLALFYNKDMLSTAGFATPPRTWSDFAEVATALTFTDAQGTIQRAGAAMGAARNINRSTDILSALMIQNGATSVDDKRQFGTFNREIERTDGTDYNPGLEALEFYTSFANPTQSNFSWSIDPTVWYSIDSFAAGQAAMMINYSHQVEEVRGSNAKLNFAVAPLPQRDDATFDVTYANYWGMAVSKDSANQIEAWEFINFLARDDNNLAYLETTGRPPAKRLHIPAFENDLDLGVFADQAAVAKSFYTPDLNITETVLADAIEDINLGERDPLDAINVAVSQLTQELQSRIFPPIGTSGL